MIPPEPSPSPRPDLPPEHDPGFAAARERAAALIEAHAAPLAVDGALVRVGTAGWTDPMLTTGEVFYPAGVTSPEQRLRHYASRFSLVEVDATYYALPTRRMAELWAERTPPNFTFDVKAHALMTGQPTEVARLPAALREALPAGLARKRRIYARELPEEMLDAVWLAFLDALAPLADAGKLGAVLLQYPRWFLPGRESRDELERARERLGGVQGAIEFRNRRWLEEPRRERVLGWLAAQGLSFVMVDAPPGLESSLPPVAAVADSALAVVRLHGRRTATWESRGVGVAERFCYLYDRAELEPWAARVREVARAAREVHVVFNNCYGNYGTTNAAEFGAMLVGG